MNPDWVSIPNDTSNVFTWEIELRIERSRRTNISFRIETRFRFMYRQSYFSVILALIHLYTWIKLPTLQTLFISATMNVDFIPSFIQEWNFDANLHDFESTFHSGSSVQSGMKNGMNSIRNELQLNPDSCKQIQFNPLWFQQKWNEFNPDWNSI